MEDGCGGEDRDIRGSSLNCQAEVRQVGKIMKTRKAMIVMKNE